MTSQAIMQPPCPRSYARAVSIFDAGGCAILPTETVYGIAARADSDDACAKLYQAKGRGFDKPLPLCLLSAKSAQQFAHVNPLAEKLMTAFWPGPLTLVLPLKSSAQLSRYVSAPSGTVALRLPDCGWVDGLKARGWNAPLALTSANPSGAASPVNAQQASEIGAYVDLIIDGGPCGIGAPSTLVEIGEAGSKLLREGALTRPDFGAFEMNWIDQ